MPNRCPPLDCFNLQPRELEANNDISGTGVLVGFVGTGYVLLLVLLINYVVYDPERRHVRTRRPLSLGEPGSKPNPIDANFLGWARGIMRRVMRWAPQSWSAYITSPDFSAAMSKSILNLCDVQIVTGLAILVSGFMVMNCGLSSYHWQIMVYLAWFSTVAHMSSLTSVRDYLSTRPWQRNIRFLMTLALLAMLITALVPTAYFTAACFLYPTSATRIWDSQYCLTPEQTTCTFQSTFVDNGPFQSAVFSIFLLVFTFITRAIKLFDPLSALASRCLTRPVSRLFHRILLRLSRSNGPGAPEDTLLAAPGTARAARPPSLRQTLLFRLVTRPVLALLLMLRLQVDLFSSMLSELFWLICILAWGTIKLLSSRNTLDAHILEEEAQWTYGQILPVLLLVMPVLGVVATLSVEGRRKPAAAGSVGPVKGEGMCSESSAAEDDADYYNGHAVHLLQRVPSNDSLEMTEKDDVMPDWLVRDYYDAFWVGYCIFFECIAIIVLVILLLCAVFNFGDGMGLESQFKLLDFWVTVFGGVYALIALPVGCLATFFVGLELDEWFRKPGGRVRKHLAMFVLGGANYIGYGIAAVVDLLVSSTHDHPPVWAAVAIPATAAALYCLYVLFVVAWTLVRNRGTATRVHY